MNVTVSPEVSSQSVSSTQHALLEAPPVPAFPSDELLTADVAVEPTGDRPTLRAELQIAASTFVTIFLAELGDKTQFTTLLMSAESHSPWTVFAGAGLALISTSLLGVVVGCWLSKRVSPTTLERAAGMMLLVIAATLFWDVFHP